MKQKNISLFIFFISLILLPLHLTGIVELDVMVFGLLGFMALPMFKEIAIQWNDLSVGLSTHALDEIESIRIVSESFKNRDLKNMSNKLKESIRSIFRTEDPKTKLTKIRMEITERLNILADLNGLGNHDFSIGYLTPKVFDMSSLGEKDSKFLYDLLLNLNNNLKSNRLDEDILRYVEGIYPTVLDVLDKKIEEAQN